MANDNVRMVPGELDINMTRGDRQSYTLNQIKAQHAKRRAEARELKKKDIRAANLEASKIFLADELLTQKKEAEVLSAERKEFNEFVSAIKGKPNAKGTPTAKPEIPADLLINRLSAQLKRLEPQLKRLVAKEDAVGLSKKEKILMSDIDIQVKDLEDKIAKAKDEGKAKPKE